MDFLIRSCIFLEDAVGATCNFWADTSVATPNGEKAIGSLRVGDRVLAWDQSTGKTGPQSVLAVLVHQDTEVEYLTVGGEQLQTRPEHSFYTEEKGWVVAGELRQGGHTRKADGSWVVIQFLVIVHRSQQMYNLTVANAYTFFVGKQQWLVHNNCPKVQIPTLKPNSKQAGLDINNSDATRVSSQQDAENVFTSNFPYMNYRNTSGYSLTEVDDLYGGKANTYHWDFEGQTFENNRNVIPYQHLQIHNESGEASRIFLVMNFMDLVVDF